LSQNIRVGELWLVDLVDALGHEQDDTRPVLVLAVHSQTDLFMVTPCTGNLAAQRFPYTHKIIAYASNGLSRDSVAMVFQTRCLSKTRFKHKLGDLEKRSLDAIKILLRTFCGI
jgi:mRNA-degrading endonuclease toxin of MazEF toxin-antitoxin module